ncbi:uncharacterized protein B0T23DRAFT_404030 [Neurospora hispaniola]|uniref:Uncharacterized protein n=1 Tax=Neurospora hispaniola TaxID=588809 RepID=A0AAJ0IBH5_9PEZI|nr:hypothetical protein B0T23DRAFT_404030 [Neurospora hispaniola]
MNGPGSCGMCFSIVTHLLTPQHLKNITAMIVRDLRRLCLIIGSFLCLISITRIIWVFPSLAGTSGTKILTSLLGDTFGRSDSKSGSSSSRNQVPYHGGGSNSSTSSSSKDGTAKSSQTGASNGDSIAPTTNSNTHHSHQTVYSVSTPNGAYFRIQFASSSDDEHITPAFNPNIIPHPTRPGIFIVVAQKWQDPLPRDPSSPDDSAESKKPPPPHKFQHVTTSSEVHCLASFVDITTSPSPPTSQSQSQSQSKHPASQEKKQKEKSKILRCLPDHPPYPLLISATPGNNCVGPLLGVLTFNVGPHDARVFYGGDGKPYTIFGSNSQFTCFGMWMQDFRVVVEWWGVQVEAFGAGEGWRVAGELQRPGVLPLGASEAGDGKGKGDEKGNEELRAAGVAVDEEKPEIAPGWSEVEKNWFVFWAPPLPLDSGSSDSSPDSSHHKPQDQQQLQTYIHYDFYPHRSFALLHDDGSATAIPSSFMSAHSDEKCLSHFLPPLPSAEPVSIHQSTNSLRLTLCNRSEPTCVVTEENTYILTMIQYKTFYHFHSEYEPYVVLFSQKAPGFEVFGVSRKPLWIEGRKREKGEEGQERTDMFYVTSVNWRDYHGDDEQGAGYHGYLDDVLIIGFGIEDKESGGIDVLAGELVKGIGICSEVVGDVKEQATTVSVFGGGEKQVEQGENAPPGSDGFPAQDIPPEIPADFPANFPAAAPAPEPVQADFGLGPGVQMDSPPPQPQPGSQNGI